MGKLLWVLLGGFRRTRREVRRDQSRPTFARANLPRWTVLRCARPEVVGATVEGHDRSQARAALKRRFGLERLPPGTRIEGA